MDPCDCHLCTGPGKRCEGCMCCSEDGCGGPDSDCSTNSIGDSTCPCTCD